MSDDKKLKYFSKINKTSHLKMTHNISKKESNSLYSVIKFVHDTFTEHKIAYWVTGGTLLGAIRHRGVIP
jgi:phosphorylcholine metabolism protein LicD